MITNTVVTLFEVLYTDFNCSWQSEHSGLFYVSKHVAEEEAKEKYGNYSRGVKECYGIPLSNGQFKLIGSNEIVRLAI